MPLIARQAVWLNPNGPIRAIDRETANILAAALGFDEPVGESPKAMYFYGPRVEERTAEAQYEKKRQLLWKDTIRYTGLRRAKPSLQIENDTFIIHNGVFHPASWNFNKSLLRPELADRSPNSFAINFPPFFNSHVVIRCRCTLELVSTS